MVKDGLCGQSRDVRICDKNPKISRFDISVWVKTAGLYVRRLTFHCSSAGVKVNLELQSKPEDYVGYSEPHVVEDPYQDYSSYSDPYSQNKPYQAQGMFGMFSLFSLDSFCF